MYAKYFGKLILLTDLYVHVDVYQGVRDVSFTENFAYVLNE